ncbi:MAG: PSD1 and planctomycete cytochrome C domain-containing protein [Planctomycetaceae bacterium]|nr:PSD1 and planctomycete cytochrome C domain-containing protein [Planctomycetaceae bacterium]
MLRFGLLILLLACPATFADDPQFARDILPTLSENCFFCHGPDEENRSADLRLDTEDGFAAAFDAADPENSEILFRVLSDDPDIAMPPPDSNRKLTGKQKQDLQNWVKSGAAWGKHWSFERLTQPSVPQPSFTEFPVHNPIDAFVQRKLKAKGLRPSDAARRSTLLRRLHLDLTGLPPAPDTVERFLRDQRPDAYERMVDQLLASPAFGERMAWDWLDAARYADSNGYQGDRERTMWPWRDWVVDAFNNNMPFSQFTTLQLAGDLLPNATAEQKLATGFCRNHAINGEGGRIPEENRVDYVMDMSETMGTVWLGLTLNCCRCHDHKYDPLTQNEYYQFYAFFNQTPVTGGGGDPQTAPSMSVMSDASLERTKSLRQQLARLKQQLQQTRASALSSQTAWEDSLRARTNASIWTSLQPTAADARHQSLKVLNDRSVLAAGSNPVNDTYTLVYEPPAGTVAAIRLEALRHESMTKNGLARSDSGNFVLTEMECSVVRDDSSSSVPIATAAASYEQNGWKVATSFDGNSRTGWAVYEGRPIDRTHAAVFRFRDPVSIQQGDQLKIVLRHDSVHRYHNLGRFRIAVTSRPDADLSGDDAALLAKLQIAPDKRSDQDRQEIEQALLAADPAWASLSGKQTQAQQELESISRRAPRVMIMQDRPDWRPTFVLNRGLYNDVTDREVSTITPASLPPLKTESPRANRLDLARWLISDENPLTARVTVNRFWAQFFGIGLVKTIEDFGVQAEYPEYRELLDWMAADFRTHNWDIKRLVRQIVTSHTYRQSSVVRDSQLQDGDGQTLNLAQVDPDNRLLARGSRYRMPSWMIRDHALAVSGLLNRQIGGAPVNTYQPAGVWEEATFGKKKYTQDTGDKLYRRSLYIFWRRIVAPTMFFDNASRQQCTVKTSRTNTPLHTLLTLNETTYVESARHLAQRVLLDKALTTDERRLQAISLSVLGRNLGSEELQILLAGLQRSLRLYESDPAAAGDLLTVGESVRNDSLPAARHAAWASICLTLLNTDEALTRE